MPYRNITQLPKPQTKNYTDHQKRAFRLAFNDAYHRGMPEASAFKIAHSAAQKAKGKSK